MTSRAIGATEVSSFLLMTVAMAPRALADVDDEGPGPRRDIGPTAGGLHLQSSLAVLQEQGDEPGVLVGAHALVAARGVAPRVADEFGQLMGLIAIERFQHIGRLAKRQRKGAQ